MKLKLTGQVTIKNATDMDVVVVVLINYLLVIYTLTLLVHYI